MIRFGVIKGFIKKEITQALRDKKMAAVIFLLPVMQLVLFGFALTNEVKNISVYCSYGPDDALMRKAEEHLLASKWFVNASPGQTADLTKILTKGEAEAIIVAPPEGLEKALERGRADIQLLIDATNAQRATQIEGYVKSIFASVLAEKFNPPQMPSIRADVKILYNPSMKSAFFMIPAIMGFALCILTVMITAMSIAKEKEGGTLEKLISSPVSVGEILLGKTIPYVFLSFIVVPVMLCTGIVLFGIPVKGGILKMLLVCLVFILSSSSVAVFVSTLAKTQQQAMMGSFMFLFPALLLSGVIFPVENIPAVVQWVAHINPLYYLASLLRNIMLKGGEWFYVLKGCGALIAIGSVLAFASVKKFNSKLN